MTNIYLPTDSSEAKTKTTISFKALDYIKLHKHKIKKKLTISARADMTFPKVVRLLLILAPSFNRVPLAPVESARSEPAKSTREIFDTFSVVN